MLAAFPGWVFARESQWLKKKKKEKQKTNKKPSVNQIIAIACCIILLFHVKRQKKEVLKIAVYCYSTVSHYQYIKIFYSATFMVPQNQMSEVTSRA